MYPYEAKTQRKSCIRLYSLSSRNVPTLKSSSTSVTSQSFIKRFSSVKNRTIHNELYSSDLKHTLSLTFQMIKTLLKEKENKVLLEKVSKIEATQNKKEKLREKKNQIKAKILVDSQICEESKRRKEESEIVFENEIEDQKENIKNKNTFFKQYRKKFNEIEIYMQRECKHFPKWKKMFMEYEILPFLLENEEMNNTKKDLTKEINIANIKLNLVRQLCLIKYKNMLINLRKQSKL